MDREETRRVAVDLSEYLVDATGQAAASRRATWPAQAGTGAGRGDGRREPWSRIEDFAVNSLGGIVIVGFVWRQSNDSPPERWLLPVDLRDVQGHPRAITNTIIEALDLRLGNLVDQQTPVQSDEIIRVLTTLPLVSS